ncbi:MAG: cation:proton antiporter [bacterium]
MTISALFFVIAAVICLGFAGSWIFRLTRIPDALLLIAAGFGLRALLGVEIGFVQTVAPYFGAFALLVILFEGGLHLEFEHMVRSWWHALRLLALSFALSFGLVFVVAKFAFGSPDLHAILYAAAVACTSAAIVIPLVRQVHVDPRIRTVLELESSLSDALAILITVLVLNMTTSSGAMIGQLGSAIFSSLTGALLVGIGGGFLWLGILRKLAGQPLTYLMTFAGMLIVYGISETIHSSGALGVFIFGLTLSNGPAIVKQLVPDFKSEPLTQELGGMDIKGFHAELTFLVRTFFFVFLGMLFSFEDLTPVLLLEGVVVYAVILMARAVAVRWSRPSRPDPETHKSARALFLFIPRGLASAVLATLPASYGVYGTESLVPLTVLIILFTNLAITVGIRWVETPKVTR